MLEGDDGPGGEEVQAQAVQREAKAVMTTETESIVIFRIPVIVIEDYRVTYGAEENTGP